MPYPTTGSGGADHAIQLNTPAFWVLVGVLALFVVMFLVLRAKTRSRRALEGFFEATEVDMAFLLSCVLLLVYLAFRFPTGNAMAYAVAQVILQGYWLTFAIPIVTVGSSVHANSRGAVNWRVPSVAVAGVLFVAIFAWTYLAL